MSACLGLALVWCFDNIKFPSGFRIAKMDTGSLVQTKSELPIILFLFSKGNVLYLPSSTDQDAGMSVRVCLCVCVQPGRTDKRYNPKCSSHRHSLWWHEELVPSSNTHCLY